MTVAEVAAPAIELADEGFPMHDLMQDTLSTASALEALRQWPTTSAVFLSRGQLPLLGARVVQKDLAGTLRRLVQAERGATSREADIEAARDRFYRGDIAEQMVHFSYTQNGWLTM
jgi:gamma-glutamyltranspeptidase/glutathione hydrolase